MSPPSRRPDDESRGVSAPARNGGSAGDVRPGSPGPRDDPIGAPGPADETGVRKEDQQGPRGPRREGEEAPEESGDGFRDEGENGKKSPPASRRTRAGAPADMPKAADQVRAAPAPVGAADVK
jgi:hypothetical protein